MATGLGVKLAKVVVDDLFARMGRSEGERLGDMLGVMMMDPGLRIFQAELAVAFDKALQPEKKDKVGGRAPVKKRAARKRSARR